MSNPSRRCFLEAASALGCGALLLSGCQAGGTNGSVTPNNGMAELPFAMFPQLQTVGGAVVVDVSNQPIAVLRTGDTAAKALSAVCTHSGCTLEIQSGSSPLFCACHGSEFGANGAVVRGPARTALRVYSATVDTTGITITVA